MTSTNTTIELSCNSALKDSTQLDINKIDLPLGLMGFPELKKMELIYNAEEIPFMHLRDAEGNNLEFLVVTPYGLIDNYTVVISDLDLDFLEIKSANDVLLLNIVTIRNEPKQEVIANLVGPVAINRKTGKAKQIVISNYQDYSARHTLYKEE